MLKSLKNTQKTREKLEEVLGKESVYSVTEKDAIDNAQPNFVVTPSCCEDIKNILTIAGEADLKVIPRGSGSKINWGGLPKGADIVISTLKLNKIVDYAFDDLTITVEAGYQIAALQRELSRHKQRLALNPLWSEIATVGGVLATNNRGLLHQQFGSARDIVLGMTIVLSDGTVARSGGKVVKNVAGYDLHKLMIGAFGTLGIITEVTFRLHSLPDFTDNLSFTMETTKDLENLLERIRNSVLLPTYVQIRTGSDTVINVDVRFESIESTLNTKIKCHDFLVSGIQQVDCPEKLWQAQEDLWVSEESPLICKISVLPSDLTKLIDSIQRISTSLQTKWRLVIQIDGTGLLRLDVSSHQTAIDIIDALRTTEEISTGSFVVLTCPSTLKPHIDVWGLVGNSILLMHNIKKSFDPDSTFNPGRFIGGI